PLACVLNEQDLIGRVVRLASDHAHDRLPGSVLFELLGALLFSVERFVVALDHALIGKHLHRLQKTCSAFIEAQPGTVEIFSGFIRRLRQTAPHDERVQTHRNLRALEPQTSFAGETQRLRVFDLRSLFGDIDERDLGRTEAADEPLLDSISLSTAKISDVWFHCFSLRRTAGVFPEAYRARAWARAALFLL